MRRAWFAMTVVLAGTLATLMARAEPPKPPNPLKGKPDAPVLSPADLALMDRAAEHLYRAPNVADGASESWKDDRTGSSGRVSVVQTFERTIRGTGLICRKVQYDVTTRTHPETATAVASWCRQPNGTWKRA